LYQNYAGPQAVITDVLGETDMPVRGLGEKKAKIATYCCIKWKPLILPGWAIEVVKHHLGYQVETAEIATEDDIQAEPNIMPECCAANWHMDETNK
jgi:hypothetical protein